jgi:hypothetical protein
LADEPSQADLNQGAIDATVTMIRATFFALGLFVTLCGVSLLYIDRLVLNTEASRQLRHWAEQTEATEQRSPWRLISHLRPDDEPSLQNVVDPPDWAGAALLSFGGVLLLYALSLPGRRRDEEDETDGHC